MKKYFAGITLLTAVFAGSFIAGQAYSRHKEQHATRLQTGPSYYLHGTGAHTAYVAAPERMLIVILPSGKRLLMTREQIDHLSE